MLQTRAFQRKPFVVQAVQVTLENMPAVVQWCGGTLRKDDLHRPYIKVEVHRAANPKQTMAYAGDWVLISATGARVYTDYAFSKSFEPMGAEVDPYQQQQQSQNVFERPDVDRKEVVENPVGDEKVVQPDSVETVVQPAGPFRPRERGEKEFPTPFARTPEEIWEAHRTGGPRTVAEVQEYGEAFKRLHGRYPGEEPGYISMRDFTPEGREAFRRLYGHYPEDSIAGNRIATDLEDYRKEHGHYPGENIDSTDA